LAGALAAVKLHIPVAHVEAGLRSFNRLMPEEINRVVTDHVSSLHFCPTETAVQNLAREGITRNVHLVGDVMHDALLFNLELAERRSSILDRLQLAPRDYLLATVHRAENTDRPENLTQIWEALCQLARSGHRIVFPVHPRTRPRLDGLATAGPPNLAMIEPVPYLDMLLLEKNADIILTDSGGVQKEACWLRVPCVTLREETEWIETVESGWNRLAGANRGRIVAAVRALQVSPTAIMDSPCTGGAARRIVETLSPAEITRRAPEAPLRRSATATHERTSNLPASAPIPNGHVYGCN
jgi:UDP-N-acetylglucosamine 2-epimerase